MTLNCAKIRTDPLVNKNPLSSAEALKETKELAMNSQEKAKLVNQSPIQKSLFDFKGNSRHKIQTTEIRKSFNNFKDEPLSGDRGIPVKVSAPIVFKSFEA